MKKLFQYLFLGYRENKEAKKVGECTFNTSFKGGSHKERFNALRTLQNEVKHRKFGVS